jgi:glycerophosphoryl diester phosphodiesterase
LPPPDGPGTLHGADVRRTTDGKGLVRALTLAELRHLDAGRWFDRKFAGERVPTLREVLELCRDKVDVLLDLKETGGEYARRVAAEVRQHGQPRRTIGGVRSAEQARLFRKVLPEARQLGLLPDPEALDAFAAAGVEMVRLWPKWVARDETLVAQVSKRGLRLHLNGTTGAEEEVRGLLRHGPDSLSADDPGRLTPTLARLAQGKSSRPLRSRPHPSVPGAVGSRRGRLLSRVAVCADVTQYRIRVRPAAGLTRCC